MVRRNNNKHNQYNLFPDDDLVHNVNNHPVHLVDRNGNPNPSAFIPLCDLGGNISIVGTSLKGLNIPVCNSFKEKFHNNQLCYEVNVNQIKNGVDSNKIIKLGLTFIVDTNKNRQIEKYKKDNVLRGKTQNIGKT